MPQLILASGSPRRREFLARLGLDFVVVVPDVDESVRPGETPEAYVERVAVAKAAAVVGGVVLAADTAVILDGEILGKPVSDDDARAMLRRLQGRTHRVLTAVAVHAGDEISAAVAETDVTMRPLDDAAIDWYVATGEPLDRAGSYALQGIGMALVSGVSGNVSNVIGLPLDTAMELLGRHGVKVWS